MNLINQDMLVSIIMPVYNVEEYLDRAVQCAVRQTYRNIEIILVDDGSTDTSGTICDKWKERDERIVVIHKKNGGLSSARNAALDICTGDYLYFFDSDDYIADDAIEILLTDAFRTGADIVDASYYNVYNDKCYSKPIESDLKIFSSVEAINYILGAKGGSISAWSKIYKKYIFDGYRYRIGKTQEDLFAIVDVLLKANVIVIEPKPVYYYVHRKNSITTEPFTERAMDALEACRYNLDIIQQKCPQALETAEFRLDYHTFICIDRIMLLRDWKDNKYLPELLKSVRDNKKRIIKSRYVANTRKAVFFMLLISPTIYHRIIVAQARKRGLSA